jgi:hypothetical protein
MKLANQPSNLLFRSEFRAAHYLDDVFRREMGGKHQYTGQVQLTVRDGFEQQRKALYQLGRTRTPRRCVLRKTQLINAVGVQARARSGAVQPARIELGQMRQQGREHLIRFSDKLARLGQQLAI